MRLVALRQMTLHAKTYVAGDVVPVGDLTPGAIQRLISYRRLVAAPDASDAPLADTLRALGVRMGRPAPAKAIARRGA